MFGNPNLVKQQTGFVGVAPALEQFLDLSISCRNLPQMDTFSPSDPFCVLYWKDEKTNQLSFIGRTEAIDDNPNPDFAKEIRIIYRFEELQMIHIDVYDKDNEDLNDLTKHDYIGYCEFILGDLVVADSSKLSIILKSKNGKNIQNNNKPAVLAVRCEESKSQEMDVHLQCHAVNLPKTSWFGFKVNSFMSVFRATGKIDDYKTNENDMDWIKVFDSEIIYSSQNPTYKLQIIELRKFCNGDYNRPIMIRIYEFIKHSEPHLLCFLKTSLQELISTKPQNSLSFYRMKEGQTKKADCSLIIDTCTVKKSDRIPPATFLDYIRGGLKIQLMVAIDFTGSNGDPNSLTSLHYMGPPRYESQYLRAIRSVGHVLEPYDSDNMIAAFGFGANLSPPDTNVSHCFPLSLVPDQVEVPGIAGVAQAYQNALRRIQLYGPTYFSEIIDTACAMADRPCNDKEQNYTILLLITDGRHDDKAKTTRAVVRASKLPLSIIIVAVGNISKNDCLEMEKLDSDNVDLIDDKGNKALRDIVQFVKYDEILQSNNPDVTLAKETLAELPTQVIEYMRFKKLPPLKKISVQRQSTYGNLFESYEGKNTNDNNNSNMYPQNNEQNLQYPTMQQIQMNPNVNTVQQMPFVQQFNAPINPYYGFPSAPPLDSSNNH